MREAIDTSEIPNTIKTALSNEDKSIVALLMECHAISDYATVVRFSLRAALREASALPGSSIAKASATCQPIERR